MSAEHLLQTPASLRPPSTDSHSTGAAISVLAHAVLVAVLALGVQWRTNEPDGVEAELWSATPELAAPRQQQPDAEPEPSRPVPTPPAPAEPVRATPPAPPPVAQPRGERDAEIAIERADKLKREKERQEADDQRAREKRQQAERDRKAEAEQDRQAKLKAEQLAAQKADKKAQQKSEQDAQRKADDADARRKAEQDAKAKAAMADKLNQAQREKIRQDQMRRFQAQLGGSGAPDSAGTAARSSGPSSSYGGRVAAYIKAQNKGTLKSDVPGNPAAEIEVTLAIDGTIKEARLFKSSGSAVWDDLALRAVQRTGTLPTDVGGTTPPSMVITLKPNPND